ncbi:MAG: radical SAM protein [Deltaproteobacteria bacterium]|nr:radical SAM protein [Deltaproteobacteria bacterium]
MRIAFVSANREVLPDAVVPLGLLYVMANVPSCHETVLCDLLFERDPHEALAARLAELRPDVVALGMRNVQDSDYGSPAGNIDYYRGLIDTVRASSQALVVVGGGGFSVMPAQLMEKLRPDFGIAGEGELAFAQLLDELSAGSRRFERVPSLFYFADGRLAATGHNGKFQKLDTLAWPDRRLVDPRYYSRHGIDSVQTKRGCALRCDYCTYPEIEGREVRQRDPAQVVDEMIQAVAGRPEIQHFFFVDSVFNLPPEHAAALCRELAARGPDRPWTCYVNPVGFRGELARLMAQAGCIGVEIGADSGCDEVLDRLRKGFRTADIVAAHEHCVAAGILDCHTFMLGTPGESMDDVRRTLDFCGRLAPAAAIMNIWTDDRESLEPEQAAAQREWRAKIKDVLRSVQDDFPRWAIPPVGARFDERLFRWLRAMGLRGPLWQHLGRIERDERALRLMRSASSLSAARS